MIARIVASFSLLGLLSCVLASKPPLPYKHDKNFLGEYSANILNMKPAQVEDFIYWMIEQRVDHNNDMLVDLDELKHWMQHIYHLDLENEITKAFFDCNKKKDNDLSFKEYRQCLFADPNTDAPNEHSEKLLLRRWRGADDNGDNRLCLTEFGAFWKPHEAHNQRMHNILVDEYLERLDKDEDHHVTWEEYKVAAEKGSNEEDVRKQFDKIDEDQDDQLSHPEIEHHLFPVEEDPSHEEAVYLMSEADDDKDDKLSHEEMIKHLKLFVGSQVLQQGRLLLRNRDEL